jgi:hypothetical protein
MLMETKSISEFWLRKEKELQSRLLIRSLATYISGYPGLDLPVCGLLYLMENGFYFENFEKRNMLFSVFQKNDSFKKVSLKVPIGSICGVNCFRKGVSEKGFSGKISNLFRKKTEGIVIKVLSEDRQETSLSFECLEDPRKIREKYRKLKQSFRN